VKTALTVAQVVIGILEASLLRFSAAMIALFVIVSILATYVSK
jgi:hypothetical protein